MVTLITFKLPSPSMETCNFLFLSINSFISVFPNQGLPVPPWLREPGPPGLPHPQHGDPGALRGLLRNTLPRRPPLPARVPQVAAREQEGAEGWVFSEHFEKFFLHVETF